jgi:Pentapeptide repeats (8 copies)
MKVALAFTALLATCFCLTCILLWTPEWMASQYPFGSTKDWAAQVTANRSMLVNFFGGLAVAGTIYFTYQNFRVSQANLDVARENTEISQDRLLTESISRSIEQLGNAQMSVRLGGIFTLARIAKASASEHYQIMEILTGHIRHLYRKHAEQIDFVVMSSGASRCPVEVQSILTTIGERYWPHPDEDGLDLSDIQISDAWLPRADLQDTFFWCARLNNWNLRNANLTNADFERSVLDGCDFSEANLTGANFELASVVNHKGLTKPQLDSAVNVSFELYASLAL